MKKILKVLLLGLLALLLIVVAGFVGWASFPLGPGEASLNALRSDSSVEVETSRDWIVFQPTSQTASTGFIFYPGARIDFQSYAPLLKPLAENGYLVVLVRMPLSFAVFSPGKADDVITAFPQIRNWIIGGHSLGGAMAANYCYTHPGTAKGLVLWAAYPASSNSLADQLVKVVSIFGNRDGEVEKIEASSSLLPPGTTWVKIKGGNHAQFGDYGPQPGDEEATISPQEQWDQVIAATEAFLDSISNK